MKRLMLVLLLSLVVATISVGQVKPSDTDSLAVTTGDSTTSYTNMWESAQIFFKGCSGYIKYAMFPGDTGSSWAGKHYMKLEDGMVLSIVKNQILGIPGLYKVKYRAVSGSGTLYITGTRKQ